MTVGVNTLLLSASVPPVPDIVALAATEGNRGIVTIPGSTGTGAFAVASVNVGTAGSITVSGDAALPVGLSLCQTTPATGVCVGSPATAVTTSIGANATPTFAIFVTGPGTVPFEPAHNRIFVRFKDGANITRGSTSVAVRTQ